MSDVEIRERTVNQTRAYLALLQAQRWDEWIDLWADDAVLEFPFAHDSRQNVYRGKRDILEYMSATTGSIVVDSVTDLRVHPLLDPEAVVVELQIAGRQIVNGSPYNQRYVTIFQYKDGKIVNYREYWNPLVSIEAFGGYEEWLTASSSYSKPKNATA